MSTPGPWAVRQSSDPRNGSDWRDIVSLGTEFPSYVGEALKKDARLIAAAPDMLSALQSAEMALLGYPHQNAITTSAAAKIRAAIERATGGRS